MNRITSLFLLLSLLSLQACGGEPARPATKFDGLIRVEALAVTPATGDYVAVKYKATNVGTIPILRVRATVILLDASGVELATKEGVFVVRGAAGGLAPGASSETTVLLKAKDKSKATSAAFKIDYLRDGNDNKIVAEGADTNETEKQETDQ